MAGDYFEEDVIDDGYDGFDNEEEQNDANDEVYMGDNDGDLRPGFMNQCVFGSSEDKEDIQFNRDICFASLFRTYWQPNRLPPRWTTVLWRLRNDAITVVEAESFLGELVQRIPDHWMAGVEISEITPHNKKMLQKHYSEGVAWRQTVFDGNKLTANQIYVLLSLFRMPQENPDIIRELNRIYASGLGLSWDMCFWLACQQSNHSGHLLVARSDGNELLRNKEKGKELLNKFSLSNGFKEVDNKHKREVFTKHRAKDEQLNNYFMILNRGGWGGFQTPDEVEETPTTKHLSKTTRFLLWEIAIITPGMKKVTRTKHVPV